MVERSFSFCCHPVLNEISNTWSQMVAYKISTELILYWFQSTYILFIFNLISLNMLTFHSSSRLISSTTYLTPFDRCMYTLCVCVCFFLRHQFFFWCDLLCVVASFKSSLFHLYLFICIWLCKLVLKHPHHSPSQIHYTIHTCMIKRAYIHHRKWSANFLHNNRI